MKIAVVYQGTFPSAKGASGADRRVRDIMRGICQRGNIVNMIVPESNNLGIENLDKNSFDIIYLGNKSKNIIISRFSFWNALYAFVLKNNFECVIFYNTTIESTIFARKLKKKGVLIGLELCDLHSVNHISPVKNFVFGIGENLLPKQTDFNIVISRYLKNKVLKNAPNIPVIQIPIMVDTNLFQKREVEKHKVFKNLGIDINDGDIVVAYTGSLWSHEGVAFLVKAVGELKKRYNNIKLVIAGKLGNTKNHDDILGIISELELDEIVFPVGWISTTDVINILSVADIMALPQANHTFSQAGLPTKLAEYASIGTAIVATNVGDVDCYFTHKHDIIFCDSESVKSLAEGIELLVTNQILRENLKVNSQKIVDKFFDYKVNGIKILDKIEKVYKSKV